MLALKATTVHIQPRAQDLPFSACKVSTVQLVAPSKIPTYAHLVTSVLHKVLQRRLVQMKIDIKMSTVLTYVRTAQLVTTVRIQLPLSAHHKTKERATTALVV
jgi:hypothetical protein